MAVEAAVASRTSRERRRSAPVPPRSAPRTARARREPARRTTAAASWCEVRAGSPGPGPPPPFSVSPTAAGTWSPPAGSPLLAPGPGGSGMGHRSPQSPSRRRRRRPGTAPGASPAAPGLRAPASRSPGLLPAPPPRFFAVALRAAGPGPGSPQPAQAVRFPGAGPGWPCVPASVCGRRAGARPGAAGRAGGPGEQRRGHGTIPPAAPRPPPGRPSPAGGTRRQRERGESISSAFKALSQEKSVMERRRVRGYLVVVWCLLLVLGFFLPLFIISLARPGLGRGGRGTRRARPGERRDPEPRDAIAFSPPPAPGLAGTSVCFMANPEKFGERGNLGGDAAAGEVPSAPRVGAPGAAARLHPGAAPGDAQPVCPPRPVRQTGARRSSAAARPRAPRSGRPGRWGPEPRPRLGRVVPARCPGGGGARSRSLLVRRELGLVPFELGSGIPARPEAAERLPAGLQRCPPPPAQASSPAVAIGACRRQPNRRSPSLSPGTSAGERAALGSGTPGIAPGSSSVVAEAAAPAGVRPGSGLSSARPRSYRGRPDGPGAGSGTGEGGWVSRSPTPGQGPRFCRPRGPSPGGGRSHHLAAAATARTKWWRGETEEINGNGTEIERVGGTRGDAGGGGESRSAGPRARRAPSPPPAEGPLPGKGPVPSEPPGWFPCKVVVAVGLNFNFSQ